MSSVRACGVLVVALVACCIVTAEGRRELQENKYECHVVTGNDVYLRSKPCISPSTVVANVKIGTELQTYVVNDEVYGYPGWNDASCSDGGIRWARVLWKSQVVYIAKQYIGKKC